MCELNQKEDLCAMIKITDIQRINAYESGNNAMYVMLNQRYDYLTELYFEMIKTHNNTELELITERNISEANIGQLNYEQIYGN